jgi:HK97 family phage portal protein
MRLLGYEITLRKASPTPTQPPSWGGWSDGWWPVIREPFPGAWQRNMEIRAENVLAYSAVYACVTLIASDIAKLRLRLVEQDRDGIWSETTSAAFSPVMRKPNRYQNRVKFFESWLVSKLTHGNTYVLKERDGRGVVTALYVLDPLRTKAYVAPDGDVFYRLRADSLSGISDDSVLAPASEIMHDVMVPLYHPLCGVSPITACALAAVQGLAIQRNSASFFANGSKPGGVLSAPGAISDDTARRLKEQWEKSYTGENVGKVAVLGDGLKYEAMSVNADDAQLIEQLKWTAETVCSCFHVPPYMIGVGKMPTYNNIEALNQQYYSQCLQGLIESIELVLDEGLGLPEVPNRTLGTEFDLQDLLRMDTATKVKTATDGIRGGLYTPDEARSWFDLKPVTGGDQVYLQQQNFSLAALAKRDAKDDPFGTARAAPLPDDDDDDAAAAEGDDGQGAEQQRQRFIDATFKWAAAFDAARALRA